MNKSVKLKFPNGDVKEYNLPISCGEVAKSISPSLFKKCICAKLNNAEVDLSREIENDSDIVFVTVDDALALEVIRHTTAHVLAQAVKRLYPNVQITIGPVIENGFYYDFVAEKPFSSDDFAEIEAEMKKIASENHKLTRKLQSREDAVKYFLSIGEKYKAEIIESIPTEQDISLYTQGEFTDLCRGPHLPSTSFVKHFKLQRVSSSYWRGDAKNQSMQRVYGTAWATKDQLEAHLHMLAEAAKRDHKRVGKDLDLFHQQDNAAGDIFWHPKGRTLYLIIEKYIRDLVAKHGYDEIKTPQMMKREIWEKSGHWEKFKEGMFLLYNVDENGKSEKETENVEYALKPMNCPGHVQIFNDQLRSYKELPIRFSEFGCCSRFESSGSMKGIMRLRSFTQDDAHIFCQEDQIKEETMNFCKLLFKVYKDFGFTDVKIKFSDRPEKRAGSDEVWDKAEEALRSATTEAGYEFEINKGEGAFYGPKLEFVLKDALGRDWQCGTLQVDFVLPERLDAEYVSKDGSRKRPVMLHRAILGSMERFIGILVEEYYGNFPVWLSPVQVVVCGVSNKYDSQVEAIKQKLVDRGIRAQQDLENDTVSYKIRKHSKMKIPYIVIIGEKEIENDTVTFRSFGSADAKDSSVENNKLEEMSVDAFISKVLSESSIS